MKAQIQEELEQKLSEQSATAAEQERVLKNRVTETEKTIAELKVQYTILWIIDRLSYRSILPHSFSN